ncbi:MAG TPA: sulfurtransferase TusA family protein [Mycobacteriales bacterium]|jgi:tRNA 2-thiouridine synthesizing protein A|nr:sulfurtransferase TusA family protein [Mycobacteriales bacterium]
MTPEGPLADPALTLDCRGQRCPLPIIVLAKRLPGVPIGAMVVLLADDPAARADVPAWCRMRGQQYLGESRPGAFEVRRVR